MPYTLLRSRRNPKILSWLAQELEKQIPGFAPYSQDRRLLAFAYKDLGTCLKVRWKVASPYQLRMMLIRAAEHRSEEVKAFLKIWIAQWLRKWRERVRLFQKIPKYSKPHLRSARKAKKIYKGTRQPARQDLKRLVVKKLVNQGEICMAEFIAETFIIQEIAQQLNRHSGKTSIDEISLNPAEILQGLLARVKKLTDRKSPVIYLKIKLDTWNA
ncbi:hypothetical protein GWO13_00745 [Candidatus Bathyarchaeota archaeon]|nr:hypothetical protein [Candidatus Bathyarchaeota archaeon]